MQRKLLLLHRKQLRERESELSLDLHNAKLIGDATVRERELESLLTKLQREVGPGERCPMPLPLPCRFLQIEFLSFISRP